MTANPTGQPLSLYLPAGYYYELSGPLPSVLGFNLTLASDGTGASIDARGLSRLFTVGDNATLSLRKINLLNGRAPVSPEIFSSSFSNGGLGCGGGALHVGSGSVARLEECVISNCASQATYVSGGAIYVGGASVLYLTDCNVTDSVASGGSVEGAFLCLAAGSGGANEARLTRCTITNSSASVTHAIASGTSAWSTSVAKGGCLYFGSSSVAQLDGCTISDSSVTYAASSHLLLYDLAGGMLYAQDSGAVQLTDCGITGSITTDTVSDDRTRNSFGGAFSVDGSVLHLTRCHVARSVASGCFWTASGGAFDVVSYGTLYLTDSTVTDSSAITASYGYGAAVMVWGGSECYLTGCAIYRSNTTSVFSAFGGAVCQRGWTGGVLHLTECIISDASATATREGASLPSAGGAVGVQKAVLRMVRCTIVNGSTTGEGGGCYTFESEAFTLLGTTVTSCHAELRGGALYVASGTALLGNGTRFYGNSAAQGGSYMVATGGIFYELPVAPGHWLPNAQCEVFRQGCPIVEDPVTGQSSAEAACAAVYDECKRTPDSFGQPPFVTLNSSLQQCTNRSFVQPCDWEATPSRLGQPFYNAPTEPQDQDFPFPCAPGFLGSSVSEHQTSSLCAGLCPAGYRG